MLFWLLAQQQPTQSDGLLQLLILVGGMFAIIYFLSIRPQRKEQATRQAMIDALKKNDKVMTTGGIYGQIVNVMEDRFVLKVDDKGHAKITVAKSAILKVIAPKDNKKNDA